MASINKKVAATAAVGAAAVAIGMGVSNAARADTPTPSPTTTQSGDANRGDGAGPGNHKGWGPGGRHGFGIGVDLSELASKLGVDESKLKDAFTAIRGDLRPGLKDLKDALKDGTPPTEAEREALKDAAKQKLADALAKELGIDAAKVRTALDQVEASREAEVKQSFSDRLDQAVKDGKLTQSEADAVKKAAEAGVIPYGPGRGKGMGMGKLMGSGPTT